MDNTHRSFLKSLMSGKALRHFSGISAFVWYGGTLKNLVVKKKYQEGGPLPCRATDKVQYQLSIDFKSNVPQNYF